MASLGAPGVAQATTGHLGPKGFAGSLAKPGWGGIIPFHRGPHGDFVPVGWYQRRLRRLLALVSTGRCIPAFSSLGAHSPK